MARDDRVLDRHFRHWRDRGLVTPELETRLREASAELAPPETGIVVRQALALLGGGLLLAFLALLMALAAETMAGDSWVHCRDAAGPWLILGLPLLAAGLASLLPGGVA